METDISLIQISGEDDSLLSLQQSPIVSSGSPYFTCSPLLHIPISTSSLNPSPHPACSTEIIKDEKDTCKSTSSSCEYIKDHNMNKENVNANKSEVPKLSGKSQQMKRKKKGGGYNLRKSLAWDRAFFTEEGVLDPLELSMLSGNTLSVIQEGRESLSSELDGPSVSPGLRALEHNLFKELTSSARNEGNKAAGKTSLKLVYSAKDKMHPAFPQNMKGMKLATMSEACPQAKRKVLSAHDINRSASKRSGCPRPGASSSQKRTSNTNLTYVTTKEPRVSKQLAPKNVPSVVSTTSRSSVTSGSHTKRSFTSPPATGQKNIGTKGISSSAKSCRNDAKSSASGKLIKKSTTQPARTMVAAKLDICSSSNSQFKVDLANNSSERLPDAVVPAAAHPLNDHDSTIRKHAVSLPQATSYYGGNMQHVQTQIAKPSGLRMPLPSLGFFGQSKPNSLSELQRDPQSCNFSEASIPTVSKAGVLNSIHRKPPRPSRKIPTCSDTLQSVTSSMNDASCGMIKSESELSDIPKVALVLQVNSESVDTVNSEQLHDADPKSSDDGDPCEKIEKLFCNENIGLQINNIKLPLQRGPCEQSEKDDGKDAVDVCLQQVEDGMCEPFMKSYSVSPEFCTASVHNNPDHTGSEVHEQQLSGLHQFELSPQKAELKPGTCGFDPISEMQSQRLHETLMEDCRSSIKGDEEYISNAADNVPEVQDCGIVSYYPTHSAEVEPTKNETSGTDCLNGGLHVGEVQMLYVESTLLVGNCTSLTYSSAADSNWMILDGPTSESAEQTEIPNSCFVTEEVSKDNCEPSKGSPQHGKCFEAGPSVTNDTLAKQQMEDRKCEPSIRSYRVSQSHTESMNNNWDKIGSQVHGQQLSRLDEFELSPQQAEPKKPGTCRIDPLSDRQSQRRDGTLMVDCRSPEKVDKDHIPNGADYVLEVEDSGTVSYFPTHYTEAEPTKDETSETDCLNGGLHVGEVQVLSVEATLSVGSCKNLTNTSAADSNWIIFDSPSAKSVEHTEIINSCSATEQVSQSTCELPSKGCLQHGKCSEESQEKNILRDVNSAELRASNVLCSLPSINQDCNFAASGKVECLHVENAFTASVDNEPLVGNVRHNVELCGEVNALALDRMYNSEIIGEIITNNVVAEKNFLNTGGDTGSTLENSDVLSQIFFRQVDIASGMNDMSLHGVIDKQSDSSMENFFSDLLPEASYSPEKETVVLHSGCSTYMHDMREHDAEQAKLVSSCSNEVEQVNQNCEVHDDTLSEENGSSKDVSRTHGCGFEKFHIPRKMDEVASVDNTAKGTFDEEALVHFTDGSSLADSNNCNIDNSLETERSLLVVNDNSRQLKQDPKLQNFDLVTEQVPLENAGLCLDDSLLLINTNIESQGKDTVKDVPSESESFLADVNADRKVEYQSSRPSSDNIECYRDCDDSNYHELDNQSCPLNLGLYSNSDGYQISSVASYESKSGSLNEKTSSTSSGSIQQNVHEPYDTILPSEAEINIHQSSASFDSELQDVLCSDEYPEAVKDATLSLNKSVKDKKQDTPAVEIPPNAVPFSDEWLAALEAAGEEILAKKSGAVQNSPPDKSLPEPSRWSPVKRKNQELGPFDCTKFTNPTDPSSTSN